MGSLELYLWLSPYLKNYVHRNIYPVIQSNPESLGSFLGKPRCAYSTKKPPRYLIIFAVD